MLWAWDPGSSASSSSTADSNFDAGRLKSQETGKQGVTSSPQEQQEQVPAVEGTLRWWVGLEERRKRERGLGSRRLPSSLPTHRLGWQRHKPRCCGSWGSHSASGWGLPGARVSLQGNIRDGAAGVALGGDLDLLFTVDSSVLLESFTACHL